MLDFGFPLFMQTFWVIFYVSIVDSLGYWPMCLGPFWKHIWDIVLKAKLCELGTHVIPWKIETYCVLELKSFIWVRKRYEM